ncbi:MAG: peptidoglycan-associated lipoprotein Pal [Pseudomonadota bacterium]
MRKKLWIHIALLVVIPGLLFTVSCAKKQVVTAESSAAATQQQAAEDAASAAKQQEMAKEQAAMTEAQQAATMQTIKDEAMAREVEMRRMAFQNENIYFDFDSAQLTPMAQDVLVRKAEWLRANAMASVVIEGHCDERGTAEYNLALGERRANAAMSFIVDLGISASRITTISYGEERPADPGNNEEAWAKNRRDVFVIQ